MQDWRFDDLTRTLGKATSRRQVLKGLVAGIVGLSVASSASGASASQPEQCDDTYQQCIDEAEWAFKVEINTCWGDPKERKICKRNAKISRAVHLSICRQEHCSCPGDTEICNPFLGFVNIGTPICCGPSEQCAHNFWGNAKCEPKCTLCETFDPNDPSQPCKPKECPTCETCDATTGQCTPVEDGTTCGNGLVCCHGGCVNDQCTPPEVFNPVTCACVCPGGGTFCNNTCVDTYNDDKNCGSCGITCSNCEQCVSGVCTQIDCGSGKDCCNGHCVDQCPPGQQLDPTTCQCVCTTGETCGPFCCSSNKVCCPDALTGQSCRDPNGNCGCNTPCGDNCCDLYTEVCCRSADYSYHCIPKGSSGC